MEQLAEQRLIIEFWDVGQGDASVLRISPTDVILIDVGPRSSPIVDWLLTQRSVQIRALILTHNDADHAGALSAVIDACAGRIDTVYFLADRDRKAIPFQRLTDRLTRACERKEVKGVLRLEAPQTIWQNDATSWTLDVRHPCALANETAPTANSTSGILTLAVKGMAKVIWAADNRIQTVSTICNDSKAEYMLGPHHGAPEDRAHEDAEEWIRRVGRLTQVISVGTNNRYEHPQPGFIKKSIHCGNRIVCTQLTPLCDRIRKTDVIKSHARLAIPRPNSGIGCRGPIRLTLIGDELISDDSMDEKHAVEIAKLERPKCVEFMKRWPSALSGKSRVS